MYYVRTALYILLFDVTGVTALSGRLVHLCEAL